MIEFKKTSEHKFLDALGIPYGELLGGDQFQPFLIISLQQGRSLLKEAVEEKRFCTADEAQVVDEAMVKAGLLPTYTEAFKKARGYKLPDGFTPPYVFKVCECGRPITHGYIYDQDGNKVGNRTIATMLEGFSICNMGVDDDAVDIPTAVSLFSQMSCVALAIDSDEMEKNYQNLPADVRRKMEEEARSADPLMAMLSDLDINIEN